VSKLQRGEASATGDEAARAAEGTAASRALAAAVAVVGSTYCLRDEPTQFPVRWTQ
jgi:hypothetical protein